MALLSATEASGVRPGTGNAWRRRAPLTGIAFAVLFVAGNAINDVPKGNASNKAWVDYFASTGNRIGLVVSAFLLVIAGLCLAGLFSTLWSRIAEAQAPRRLSPLPLVAAGISAASIAAGAVLNAAVAGGMLFGSLPEPNADILRFANQLGYPLIMVGGMLAAALAIAGISLQANRVGIFSRRLTVFGLVAAVITLFSFVFLPMVITVIWFLVVSVVLLRRRVAPDQVNA